MAKDGLSVEVHGLRELADGSLTLARKIEQGAPKQLQEAAGSAASAARGRVPRVSGRLASSLHTGVSRDAAWLGFGDGVPYAGWIEFGGSRTGNRGATADRAYVPEGRFLYPAARDTEAMVASSAERAARDEIGAMRWPTPNA
jgi:phage gpG-like protein